MYTSAWVGTEQRSENNPFYELLMLTKIGNYITDIMS